MDAPEPDQTPFAAVSAHTSRFARVRLSLSAPSLQSLIQLVLSNTPIRPPTEVLTLSQHYQSYLDASTPYVSYRWIGTASLLFLFFLRIVIAQGWYIVAYTLGI